MVAETDEEEIIRLCILSQSLLLTLFLEASASGFNSIGLPQVHSG